MSYDVYAECDQCCRSHGALNHTCNTVPMFDWALGCEDSIRALHGLPCLEAAERLREAIKKCEAAEFDGELSKWDAPNGWGTGRSSLEFLREILRLCEDNPRLKVRVRA